MKDFKTVYLIKKVGTEQYLCNTEWKGEKFIEIKSESKNYLLPSNTWWMVRT